MKHFDIAHNDFSGTLPLSLPTWKDIIEFNIEGNRFEGAIPEVVEVWRESLKQGANFAGNNFTGTLGGDRCATSPDEAIPFKVDCAKVECPCCVNCLD